MTLSKETFEEFLKLLFKWMYVWKAREALILFEAENLSSRRDIWTLRGKPFQRVFGPARQEFEQANTLAMKIVARNYVHIYKKRKP